MLIYCDEFFNIRAHHLPLYSVEKKCVKKFRAGCHFYTLSIWLLLHIFKLYCQRPI